MIDGTATGSELPPALEALAERPPLRRDVVQLHGPSVAGDDAEREALPDEAAVAAGPDLSPVLQHVHPLAVARPPGRHDLDIPGASDIEDEHTDPPLVALHLKVHAATLGAGHTSVCTGMMPTWKLVTRRRNMGLDRLKCRCAAEELRKKVIFSLSH